MENLINCLKNSGYSNLNNLQQHIRMIILNMIIDKGSSVSYDEIRQKCIREGIDISLTNLTINKFEKEQYLVSEDEMVLFMYPISSKKTNHRVKLADGREFYAMCAIDSLGSSITFDQDIEINSKCMVTQKEINIKIKNNKISYVNNKDIYVLHVNIDNYSNWASSC